MGTRTSTRKTRKRTGGSALRRGLLLIAALLIVVDMAAYAQISTRDTAAVTGDPVAAGGPFMLHSDGTIRSGTQCVTAPDRAASRKSVLTLQPCDGRAAQRWSALGGAAMLNEAAQVCLNAMPSSAEMFAYPCGAVKVSPPSAKPSASPSASASPSSSPRSALAKVDPSGVAMPLGNLPGWRQVFADDFSQNVPLGSFPDAVSNRWGGYDGSRDTSKNGLYSPEQVVSISNGMMNLHLHTANGTHLVAAPVPKLGGTARDTGLKYGRFAVRFRADAIPGYKTAWLLWPDSDNWPDGEIDFPEGSLNGDIMAHAHHVGDPEESTSHSAHATYTSWHTAVIEWTPSSLSFILDGKVIGHETDSAYIPSVSMHWVLQTETDLDGSPPSDSAQGNVQIDWVAAWARD